LKDEGGDKWGGLEKQTSQGKLFGRENWMILDKNKVERFSREIER
jgi:hypothetical protein